MPATARSAARKPHWFLYVLRCADDSLYTGIARDVNARLAAHAAGRGARYTRGRGPFTVLAHVRCIDHSEALRAERAFKRLARPRKLAVLSTHQGLAAFVRAMRAARVNPSA